MCNNNNNKKNSEDEGFPWTFLAFVAFSLYILKNGRIFSNVTSKHIYANY